MARLPVLVALLFGLAVVIVAPVWPHQVALHLLSDDAFYYLEIAQNVVGGRGVTFDGLVPTNGFHPLWLVVVSAITALVGSGQEASMAGLVAAEALLAVAMLLSLNRLVERYTAPGHGALAVAACLLPNVFQSLINGMETGLLLLAITLLLWAACRFELLEPRSPAGKNFLFGMGAGLVVLCRLDVAFLLPAIVCVDLAVLAARGRWLPDVRYLAGRLLPLAIGSILVVSPYFAWNLLCFGELMPISGTVKSALPGLRASLTLKHDMPYGLALLVAVTALSGLAATFARRRGEPLADIFRWPLWTLLIACALHFLHGFLFIGWGFYWWHVAPYGIAFALALSRAARELGARWPGLRGWARFAAPLALTVVALVLDLRIMDSRAERHRGWAQGAAWARDHTPEDAIFALKDAGLFGYLSRRHVVNLDGKANGYAFLEYLRSGDVERYLDQVGVDYIAHVDCRYWGERARIQIPRVNQRAIEIWLEREDELFRVAATGGDRLPLSSASEESESFCIWRYHGAGR